MVTKRDTSTSSRAEDQGRGLDGGSWRRAGPPSGARPSGGPGPLGHNFSSKEQVSFSFMDVVTICSDFGAPKNKV